MRDVRSKKNAGARALRAVTVVGLAGLIWLGLDSCSWFVAPAYVVTLKDGSRLIAKGWPQLDETTRTYRVRGPDGDETIVREFEVVEIQRSATR